MNMIITSVRVYIQGVWRLTPPRLITRIQELEENIRYRYTCSLREKNGAVFVVFCACKFGCCFWLCLLYCRRRYGGDSVGMLGFGMFRFVLLVFLFWSISAVSTAVSQHGQEVLFVSYARYDAKLLLLSFFQSVDNNQQAILDFRFFRKFLWILFISKRRFQQCTLLLCIVWSQTASLFSRAGYFRFSCGASCCC